MNSPQGLGSIVMLRRWQETSCRYGLISAQARCWLPSFLSLHCTISSDYWHYSKFAADNQPQIPAKFLITLLEMSLGL